MFDRTGRDKVMRDDHQKIFWMVVQAIVGIVILTVVGSVVWEPIKNVLASTEGQQAQQDWKLLFFFSFIGLVVAARLLRLSWVTIALLLMLVGSASLALSTMVYLRTSTGQETSFFLALGWGYACLIGPFLAAVLVFVAVVGDKIHLPTGLRAACGFFALLALTALPFMMYYDQNQLAVVLIQGDLIREQSEKQDINDKSLQALQLVYSAQSNVSEIHKEGITDRTRHLTQTRREVISGSQKVSELAEDVIAGLQQQSLFVGSGNDDAFATVSVLEQGVKGSSVALQRQAIREGHAKYVKTTRGWAWTYELVIALLGLVGWFLTFLTTDAGTTLLRGISRQLEQISRLPSESAALADKGTGDPTT